MVLWSLALLKKKLKQLPMKDPISFLSIRAWAEFICLTKKCKHERALNLRSNSVKILVISLYPWVVHIDLLKVELKRVRIRSSSSEIKSSLRPMSPSRTSHPASILVFADSLSYLTCSMVRLKLGSFAKSYEKFPRISCLAVLTDYSFNSGESSSWCLKLLRTKQRHSARLLIDFFLSSRMANCSCMVPSFVVTSM